MVDKYEPVAQVGEGTYGYHMAKLLVILHIPLEKYSKPEPLMVDLWR